MYGICASCPRQEGRHHSLTMFIVPTSNHFCTRSERVMYCSGTPTICGISRKLNKVQKTKKNDDRSLNSEVALLTQVHLPLAWLNVLEWMNEWNWHISNFCCFPCFSHVLTLIPSSQSWYTLKCTFIFVSWPTPPCNSKFPLLSVLPAANWSSVPVHSIQFNHQQIHSFTISPSVFLFHNFTCVLFNAWVPHIRRPRIPTACWRNALPIWASNINTRHNKAMNASNFIFFVIF